MTYVVVRGEALHRLHAHAVPKATPSRHEVVTPPQALRNPRPDPGGMSDTSQLAKNLAAAAEPCFDTGDRLAVCCEMNLGAQRHAIDEIIGAVVRKEHPMPARLIDDLRRWLACDPIDDKGDYAYHLAQRVARVRTR